jgi:hypothetical protein
LANGARALFRLVGDLLILLVHVLMGFNCESMAYKKCDDLSRITLHIPEETESTALFHYVSKCSNDDVWFESSRCYDGLKSQWWLVA